MATIERRGDGWRVRWRDPDGTSRSRQCPSEERDTGPWSEPHMRRRWTSIPLDSRGVYLWRRDAARFPLAGPKGKLP